MQQDLKKDVWISVSGVQSDGTERAEPVTFETRGSLYRKGGQYFLRYDESEVTGLAGTSTTIKADGDCVSVIRTGKNPSDMHFAVGEKRMAFYDTDYGEITMVVNTKKIENGLSENGGIIDVLYELEIENTPAFLNRIRVKVEEKRARS